MKTGASGAAQPRQHHLVAELSEDLDVAIREFLERHPGTSACRIRQAIRLLERDQPGGGTRRLAVLFAVSAVFAVGLVLGMLVGQGR